MNIINDDLLELISLTRQYLLQEFSYQEKLYSSIEEYTYFRDYAIRQQSIQKNLSQTSNKIISPKSLADPESKVKEGSGVYSKNISIASPSPEMPKRPSIPTLDVLEKQVFLTSKLVTSKLESSPKEESIGEKEKTVKEEKVLLKEDKKTASEVTFFIPAQPTEQSPTGTHEMRQLIKSVHPKLTLLEVIPDDAEARAIAMQWKYPKECVVKASSDVLMIIFDDVPEHLTFLNNIEKAIIGLGYKVNMIIAEKIKSEKEWEVILSDSTRIVLATHSRMQSFPDLFKYYQEIPSGENLNSKCYLNKIPVLPLYDLSRYLQEPPLKIPLWKAIKESLSSTINRL